MKTLYILIATSIISLPGLAEAKPARDSIPGNVRKELGGKIEHIDNSDASALSAAVMSVIQDYPSLAPLLIAQVIEKRARSSADRPFVEALVADGCRTYPLLADSIIYDALRAMPDSMRDDRVAVVKAAVDAVPTTETKAAILASALGFAEKDPTMFRSLNLLARASHVYGEGKGDITPDPSEEEDPSERDPRFPWLVDPMYLFGAFSGIPMQSGSFPSGGGSGGANRPPSS